MSENIIGVITARMNSKRLPGKVMKDLAGKSVFAHHVERLRKVESLNGIFLATSFEREANAPLIEEAKCLGVPYYEGEKEDVLERHEEIIDIAGAAALIRVTCDMPLFDIPTLDKYIEEFYHSQPDYIYPGNYNYLSGTMCELVSARAIRMSHQEYKGPAITRHIIENPDKFKMIGIMVRNDICRTDVRLDLDYPEDYELIKKIYEELYKGEPIPLEDVYKFLDDNPSLILINKHKIHNEVNIYTQNLLYNKPIYQIVKSGERIEILNETGQFVEYEQFLKEMEKLLSYKTPRIDKSV